MEGHSVSLQDWSLSVSSELLSWEEALGDNFLQEIETPDLVRLRNERGHPTDAEEKLR